MFAEKEVRILLKGQAKESFFELKKRNDKESKSVINSIERVIDVLRQNPQYGNPISKDLIPDKNDSPEELKKLAKFITSVDKNIPWHISRFFPMYKMLQVPITDINKLKEAEQIGKKAGLKFVHVGNV